MKGKLIKMFEFMKNSYHLGHIFQISTSILPYLISKLIFNVFGFFWKIYTNSSIVFKSILLLL